MAVFQLWDTPALVLSKDQRSVFATIKEGLARMTEARNDLWRNGFAGKTSCFARA